MSSKGGHAWCWTQSLSASYRGRRSLHPRPPFTPSLGLTPGGEYLNVNADDLAAALTTALRADRLLYVTESGGVRDAERRRLPVIKVNEIPTLIRKGVVRDGMILKLRSCARTLRHDVGEIDILSPTARNGLRRVVENRALVGTRIVKGSADPVLGSAVRRSYEF